MSLKSSIPFSPRNNQFPQPKYPGRFRIMPDVLMYRYVNGMRDYQRFDWITTDVLLLLNDRGWWVVADGRVHL